MFDRLRNTVHVAVWEFQRFYRLRDQLLSLALAIVGGGIGFAVQVFVGVASGPVTVAVIGADRLPPLTFSAMSKIELRPQSVAYESLLRSAVGTRELDGLLIIEGPDRAELFVTKEPIWALELRASLTDARSRAKLQSASIDSKKLDDVFAPMPLEVTYHSSGRGATSSAEKIVAAAFVAFTCMGVFLGMASFFAGITGEKALRVTEQVVAAISPQTWVDGKLLGLTAAALGSLMTHALALGLFLAILSLGGMGFSIPWTALRPGMVAVYLILAVLGMLFWNCVFAAIAVTINDPNSSARSSLMFLPILFVGMGFPGLQTPDSMVMKALSVLPGTSPTVMTARLVLTDVAAWEIAAAIGLNILSILFVRRIAGKIFAANILMTGKELSLRELWRGLRRA